jgi:NADPH-dependent curcumin reductase CurA
MAHWLSDGQVRSVETIRTGGVDAAFDAFVGMLQGRDIGKTIVAIG